MTNSKPRPTCYDCKVQLNRSNRTIDTSRVNPLCDRCYDVAGLENEHQDGMHEEGGEYGPSADCPMCTGVPIADRSRKGHAGTTVARGSHADCYAAKAHDATKAGRAGCRKMRAAQA